MDNPDLVAVFWRSQRAVFDVPVVLSSVETEDFSGNYWQKVLAIFPGQVPMERSTMNSWDDKNFVVAIE